MIVHTTLVSLAAALCGEAAEVSLDAPSSCARFDIAEFVLTAKEPPLLNPFTDAAFSGEFQITADGNPVKVTGFADAQDGTLFRLRFSPDRSGATYRYTLLFEAGAPRPELRREFRGELRCDAVGCPGASDRPEAPERPAVPDGSGPVVVDPQHPKHFVFTGSRKPFYHLGFTAYHLLDPSNDMAQIDRTIDYAAQHGFNVIRFLLTGYPRDTDTRTSQDAEHGVPDPWKAPNYGARPAQVNALPAWVGKPHAYDFTRFDVEHWRRADHAVRRMRERGIVATCIVTIEKQDLPSELGRLSENELRLYRYAVARLSAFNNVRWDLGNEHNEYRDVEWGNAVGALVKEIDPYDRLASAHGYAEFLYSDSRWADFIVTQQYGDERKVHDWALRYTQVAKPYVNEEYGYEGSRDEPGHAQNPDRVRRCHWAIAMAGGYATYGDWSGGVSYFYMGEPGPGKAALQLKHLRAFFEGLPFPELRPRDELTKQGFCLAAPPRHHVFYLPEGGEGAIVLEGAGDTRFSGMWYDPRTGTWKEEEGTLRSGTNRVVAPGRGDWVLHVRGS